MLKYYFNAIDCFDQCPVAVKELEKLQLSMPAIKKVDQASMQSYHWEERYNCILLRWCVGYLSDDALT